MGSDRIGIRGFLYIVWYNRNINRLLRYLLSQTWSQRWGKNTDWGEKLAAVHSGKYTLVSSFLFGHTQFDLKCNQGHCILGCILMGAYRFLIHYHFMYAWMHFFNIDGDIYISLMRIDCSSIIVNCVYWWFSKNFSASWQSAFHGIWIVAMSIEPFYVCLFWIVAAKLKLAIQFSSWVPKM